MKRRRRRKMRTIKLYQPPEALIWSFVLRLYEWRDFSEYNKFMENRKYRKTINIFPHKILKNSQWQPFGYIFIIYPPQTYLMLLDQSSTVFVQTQVRTWKLNSFAIKLCFESMIQDKNFNLQDAILWYLQNRNIIFQKRNSKHKSQ